MTTHLNIGQLLETAKAGIEDYLNSALDEGRIDSQLHGTAAASTLPNLQAWLEDAKIDELSPNAKAGIAAAIEAGQWEAIVNAYRQDLSFGTGGIRGMMAFDRESIVALKETGIDAPILKGPNTLNNLVLMRVSAGVAQFGRDKGFSKIVIGYDSRVRGGDFARMISELFLAYGFTVYLFDEPCPYPEVTFTIPNDAVKSDLGILISASHNDYRYNGYKLSCGNGSQFDPTERDEMYKKYIMNATFDDVKLCPLADAETGKLIYLGGSEQLPDVDYGGRDLLNLHDRHRDHILEFLLAKQLLGDKFDAAAEDLKIGYCAYHGVGRKAVPRLLSEAGYSNYTNITADGLFELNGLFPSFCSDPGKEQQPDPGDFRAADVAVKAFKAEHGDAAFDEIDILIGTDPDADRCGMVVKVPENQRHLYEGRDWVLLPADDVWALVVWFRLYAEKKLHGEIIDADKKFITQSATTSDSIVKIAVKNGLGAVKTWVGFANLAAGTRMIWDKEDLPDLFEGRTSMEDPLCHPFVWEFEAMEGGGTGGRSFNLAAMEQSNGFSLLGGAPPDARSLGRDGHVRDKDGTFAAILVADMAAWAKANGTSLFELVDKHIYLDPDVGLFINLYEPDPMDGEYPGIQGDRKKKNILRRAMALFHMAKAGGLKIGPYDVVEARLYRTGKYDHVYPPTHDFQFPDEGLRFYFNKDRLSHVTVRPSGTGNALRLHVQLHADVDESNLIDGKAELRAAGQQVMDDVREKLGALRE